MPTGFISSATLNAPIFALTSIHSLSGVGLFNRANQLLSMPLSLFGGAIAQVFQRRATQDVHASGHCRPLFYKTFVMLFAGGLVPTLLLAFAAPELFGWLLGPNWIEAGNVARLLAPMLLLRVVSSPLSTVFYVVGAQRLDFFLTTLGCAITWGAVVFAALVHGTTSAIVGTYAISYSLTYAVFIVTAWKLAGGHPTIKHFIAPTAFTK
jgi:O-antigen/teichoic acid export membrane protein